MSEDRITARPNATMVEVPALIAGINFEGGVP